MSVDTGDVFAPPGVYRPQADSRLLARALESIDLQGASVLDFCTGTGVLALTAARLGAASVLAVDISRLAVVAARCNALVRRAPVRVVLGGLGTASARGPFDIVVANPPYVPCPDTHARWQAQRWTGGVTGRSLLNPLCDNAATLLRCGGSMVLVHSALSGEAESLHRLRAVGLSAGVVARETIPFGPVLRAQRANLVRQGFCASGVTEEELVVIRADRA